MDYKEIYSRSYMKKYDPNFFNDKEFAYETMREWMKEIITFPYVRKIFTSYEFNDMIENFEFELVKSIDKETDEEFIKKLFSDGFIICWMRPKVDSVLNLAVVIGGKDEKKIQSNYEININRLESLERKHKKLVRDYGYSNGVTK